MFLYLDEILDKKTILIFNLIPNINSLIIFFRKENNIFVKHPTGNTAKFSFLTNLPNQPSITNIFFNRLIQQNLRETVDNDTANQNKKTTSIVELHQCLKSTTEMINLENNEYFKIKPASVTL